MFVLCACLLQCQYFKYGQARGDGAPAQRSPGRKEPTPRIQGHNSSLVFPQTLRDSRISLTSLQELHYFNLVNDSNSSLGSRDGSAKTGAGRGEEKKGGPGEKTTGGDQQTAEAHRPGGETERETEGTGTSKKLHRDIKGWC